MNTKYRIIVSLVAVAVLVGLYLMFGTKGESAASQEAAPATFQIK